EAVVRATVHQQGAMSGSYVGSAGRRRTDWPGQDGIASLESVGPKHGVDWTPGACRPRPDYGCRLARRWGPDEPVADAACVLDAARPARSLDLRMEPAD